MNDRINNSATDFKVLIIGNGRLSLHLRYYLTNKRIPWQLWTRNESRESLITLKERAQTATLACLAVSDGAIEEVAASLPSELLKIHFSGLHRSKRALGIHPLMTFGSQLLAPDVYEKIPLVVDPEVQDLLWIKDLSNPVIAINKNQRALYHGLCHLAGNYPKFLWENVAQIFEEELRIPRSFLQPYLEQVLLQVINKQTDLEAGPFGRKDHQTISAHLDSLNSYPNLKSAYLQFYESDQQRRAYEPAGNN